MGQRQAGRAERLTPSRSQQADPGAPVTRWRVPSLCFSKTAFMHTVYPEGEK